MLQQHNGANRPRPLLFGVASWLIRVDAVDAMLGPPRTAASGRPAREVEPARSLAERQLGPVFEGIGVAPAQNFDQRWRSGYSVQRSIRVSMSIASLGSR